MASSIAISSDVGAARRSVRRTAVIVGLAAALGVGLVAFTRSSFFDVRGIEVVGNASLSRAAIVDRSGIEAGTNAIWLDEGTIAERLEGSEWIRDVDVSVRLPWTIRVSVKERRPVAVVHRGSGPILVAGDGVLLGAADGASRFPRIEAPGSRLGPRRAVALSGPARAAAALPRRIRNEVLQVVVGPSGTIELVLRGGLRVELGAPTDLEAKVGVLQDVLRWTAAAEEAIDRIDVSAPMAPAVLPAS